MKVIKKEKQNFTARQIFPDGIIEFLAALGVIVIILLLAFFARSCELGMEKMNVESGILEDIVAPADDTPTQTTLNIVSDIYTVYPFAITENVVIDKIYSATGYFPENGTDEEIENVLAVRITNISKKSIEYSTFSLTVNDDIYKFAAATLPAEKSVYVFNTEMKHAPDEITYVSGEAEFEISFTEEPSAMTDVFSFMVQNGNVIVKNTSSSDISSDIVVYYKSTVENDYFGGITYRFRITGGLAAGESFNAYAPHAYAHMTEIMFVQYE